MPVLSADELSLLAEAQRVGGPYLCWREDAGEQLVLPLGKLEQLTVGRRTSNDVVLANDCQASRLHAKLELIDQDWTVIDDGLSRNGTFVNGSRVTRRRRLRDGDALRFGSTLIHYRNPAEGTTAVTAAGGQQPTVDSLTEVQRRILVALCHPLQENRGYAAPATNVAIAAEVFLGVDAVKSHMRQMFRRFGIGDLPQNQKRAQLAAEALRLGLASEPDGRGA